MKFALLFVILTFIVCFSDAGKKRYKPLKVYSEKHLKKAYKNDPNRLLGPDGSNPALTKVVKPNPGAILEDYVNDTDGIESEIRVRRQNRPQVVNANFGVNAGPPGFVEADRVISPGTAVPPDPSFGAPLADNLRRMSRKERNRVAQHFFVQANYTPTGLANDGATLVRQMQRNYGIEESGELDDLTITLMMTPRCGFPDPPANFQTFPNRDKWNHNPVTYKFAGYTPDISPCQVRNALKRALRVWEEVIELDFEEVDSDSADVIIYFGFREHGDGYPFDERNGLLAHAFTAGRSSLSGDTHFDEAEHWTLGEGQMSETYYGNSDGDPCVFPFIFENQEYTTCTRKGRNDGLEWCATTRNYDTDGKWGFCSHERLFTYGGNSQGDPCVFPFTFMGQTFDTCTFEGRADGYRWCSTTSNYDEDGQWGFCPDREHGTYGGNSDGAPCHFPFTFNGNTYSECTVVGRRDFKPWCSTTADFDRDEKFGLCQDTGYSLFLVAAHEFGHVIGLDHSFDPNALMYPTYQNFENFRLPQDDIRGAQSLYPPRTSNLPPLELERCGGDLMATDGDATTQTPRSSLRSTTTPPTPSTPSTTTRTSKRIGFCDDQPISALLVLGREIFVFKDRHFWRMFGAKSEKNGPFLINNQWPGLPNSIDAVYQRPGDDSVVFFKGTRYWRYDGFRLRAGYPKRVTTLGLPGRGDLVVDGVLNWKRSKNRKRTYFFVGDEYYRFNEERDEMDRGYPKAMSIWRGVPGDLRASMVDPTSKRKSLFVDDNLMYVLDNYKTSVINIEPISVHFGCQESSPGPVPLISAPKKSGKTP